MREVEAPSRTGPQVKILRVAGETPIGLWAVAPRPRWFAQHFHEYCTKPCTRKGEDRSTCELCAQGIGERVKGYLDVFHGTQRKFLELTIGAWDDLLAECAAGDSIRGVCFTVRRSKGKTGKLLFALRPEIADAKKIPQPIDPTEHVKALLEMQGRYRKS